MDFFEHHNKLPEKIACLVERFLAMDNAETYSWCTSFLEALQEHGWSFDFGLDGVPFSLRPFAVQE